MNSARSTEEQRQAFLESLYSNYTELQVQSEEVQERKRRIDYDTYDSNAKEIHNLLFSESDAAEKDLGDRATYDQVQSVLKKIVYGRSHQLMHADKGTEALHVRITTLETTIRSQDETIRQLKAVNAASEEEVCGLLRQLSAKDSDIRVLTSKVNRHFMQMRALERECAALRSDLAYTAAENQRLNALQVAATAAVAAAQVTSPPFSASVLDADSLAKGSALKQRSHSMSSFFKAGRRRSSLGKKNAPLSVPAGATPDTMPSNTSLNQSCANSSTGGTKSVPAARLGSFSSRTSSLATGEADVEPIHNDTGEARVSSKATQDEVAPLRSGRAVVHTADSTAHSSFLEFQADLELLVGANRRLERENAEMRQQLQAMMLDEQEPGAHFFAGATGPGEGEDEMMAVYDDKHVETAKAALLANKSGSEMLDHDKRIGFILAHAPQSAALMNLQSRVRKCTSLIESEAAATMRFLDFDAAPVQKVDFAQQHESVAPEKETALPHALGACGGDHVPTASGSVVSEATARSTGAKEGGASIEDGEQSRTTARLSRGGSASVGGKLTAHAAECAQPVPPSLSNGALHGYSYLSDETREQKEKANKREKGTGEEEEKEAHRNATGGLPSFTGSISDKDNAAEWGVPTDEATTAAAASSSARPTAGVPGNPASSLNVRGPQVNSSAATDNEAQGDVAAYGREEKGEAAEDGKEKAVPWKGLPQHSVRTGLSTETAKARLGDLKTDFLGVHSLYLTLHEEVSSFFALLNQLFMALAAASKRQTAEVQSLMDDVIEEAVVSMAKDNVLQSFKNKYDIDIERKELTANMTDEEWLAQHLKNIAVEMVEKKIQHVSTAAKGGNDTDKDSRHTSTSSRASQGAGGRLSLSVDKRKGAACGAAGVVHTRQETAAPQKQSIGSGPEAGSYGGEGARVAFDTSSYPAPGAPATSGRHEQAPKKPPTASQPFSFGNDVRQDDDDDDDLRLRGQRCAPATERIPGRRNPLKWFPIPNFEAEGPVPHPVFQAMQKHAIGKSPAGRLDVIELLRQLQPDDDGSVEDMRPTVYRYVMPSTYDAARQYAKDRIQRNTRFVHSPQFDAAVKDDILPIAQKADDIAKGKYVVDAPLLKAVKELRLEDANRRKRNAELLFRRVATNIKMRRLMKQQQQVYSGNAFSSYLSLLYNRWAANQTQQSRKRAFEETQLRLHLLEACGLKPQQHASAHGPRTVSSAPKPTHAPALPPLRGSHKGGARPFRYQKGSSFHFKDVNFADDRGK